MENMFKSDYEYGTNEYVRQYVEFFRHELEIVKLKNGEMLIAFVHDDIYENKTCLTFPYLVIRTSASTFELMEYTPSLDLKTITIENSEILFSSIPDADVVEYCIEFFKNNLFVNEFGTRTAQDGTVVSVSREEYEIDQKATVKTGSDSYH